MSRLGVGKSVRRFGRLRAVSRGRKVVATSLAVVTSIVTIATVAVVAVGAVNVLSSTSSPSHLNGVDAGRWVVARDQSGAPVVPSSGGAAGGAGSFNAVSCPSATECVAVGGDANLGGVASTSLNGGGTWSQGAMEANEPQLDAVDCSTTSVCVAVGQGATVRSTDGGKTWTSNAIPTTNTTLLGVNCPSATTCVSVGVSPNATGPYGGQLLISSNGGTTWSVPTLPASMGALGSVDCPTSTFCVAVGSSVVVSNDGGKTWAQRTVSGGTGVLRSVSCLSTTTCVAIGANPGVAQDPNAAAFETVTSDGGATWSSVAMPPGSATLDVLSCSSSGCQAAGSAFKGTAAPVFVSSSGSTWTANQSLGASVTAISAISCPTGTNCVFVGEKGKSPVTVSTVNGVATSGGPVIAQVRAQRVVAR